MNRFVADPDWGWWIILYFYVGGIAAGSYFLATLIELWGQDADRPLARLGYRIAFPLISLCGVFLIVDLERPERFWHMMFQSEVVDAARAEGWPMAGWGTMLHAPLLKWWSPMSIGAWALALFGAWSFLSFIASFSTDGRLTRLLGPNLFGCVFHIIGSCLAFFVASYTGVLVSATNQPIWSATEWIAPLFLTSAASTAISVFLLLGRSIAPEARARLEKADLWALGLELFLFLSFLASLGSLLPLALRTWQGSVLIYGVLVVGLLLPLFLHLGFRHAGAGRAMAAALLALVGGFLLRFGMVAIGPALLAVTPDAWEKALAVPLIQSWEGMALLVVTVVLALVIPFLLQRQWSLSRGRTALAGAVSLLVIGVVLFNVMQSNGMHDVLFASRILPTSPEAGRPIDGGFGASLFNHPEELKVPHSKFTKGGEP